MSSEQSITLSLRMPHLADYQALKSVAGIQGKSVAALAQGFILEGLRRGMDPAEIERLMDEEKARLMQAAAERRAGGSTS